MRSSKFFVTKGKPNIALTQVSVRKTGCISITAIMGTLAIILSLYRVEIPFPILVFLKIDFAEIPSFITYYLLGFNWGLLCSVIHWIMLLARSGDPVGPTMKFLAVSSNLIGMYFVKKITGRVTKIYLILELVSGAIVRIAVMTIANIIVLEILFPYYLGFSKMLLENAGVRVATENEALVLVLVIVGFFNMVHALVSALPALAIVSAIKKRLTSLFD